MMRGIVTGTARLESAPLVSFALDMSHQEFAVSPAAVRRELAQSVARYIVCERCPWQTAKIKALEGMPKLPAGTVPNAAEIESAVRETCAIFEADAHRERLARLRHTALRLMCEWFADFDVTLTGAVLNGAATDETNIHLEIFTDNAKEVEIVLLTLGVNFDVLDTIDSRMPAPLEVLTFLAPQEIKNSMPPAGVLVEIHSTKQRGRNPYRHTPDAWQQDWEASGRIDAKTLQTHLN